MGKVWMEFNKLIFIGPDGNDANPGTKELPVKSYVKAVSLVESDNNAIIFLPGEHYLGIGGGSDSSDIVLRAIVPVAGVNKLSVIGQGKDSVIYCDGSLAARRDGNLIQSTCPTDFYRMNIKYKTKGGSYQSAILHWTAYIRLFNCAIENIGGKTMSVCYYNGASNIGSFYNSLIKCNGLIAGDYSARVYEMFNTLLDWNFTNVVTTKNKLVRVITEDDFLTGSAADLIATDGSEISVYGGDYTWGDASAIYTVTESFADEEGAVLLPNDVKRFAAGEDYAGLAPYIEGHVCVGYKLDGGALQNGDSVSIMTLGDSHSVLFVYEKEVVGGGTAAGAVMHFALAAAPKGWLACDGRAVSRSQYGTLFSAVGTLFGAGDGVATFNLPDLRGEFIRGLDMGKGIDAGRALGSGQKGTLMMGDFNGVVRPHNVALLPCIKY